MTAQRGDSKKDVFDLDAARASRREAAGEGFTFVFGKESFSCLPAKEWPVTVTAALSEGDLIGALQLILGDQAESFLSHGPTTGDVEDLMTAMASFSGVGTAGN